MLLYVFHMTAEKFASLSVYASLRLTRVVFNVYASTCLANHLSHTHSYFYNGRESVCSVARRSTAILYYVYAPTKT